MRIKVGGLILSSLLLAIMMSGCNKKVTQKEGTADLAKTQTEGGESMSFELTSDAFTNNGMIPAKYTCDGQDISPQLNWTGAPANTKSFALICDDPDAPMGTWIHWVIYNIPATVDSLPENTPADKQLANGAINGINSWGRLGYGGPCPPSGVHHYIFTLYALDLMLDLSPGASKSKLLDAMKGHILAETRLTGLYKR